MFNTEVKLNHIHIDQNVHDCHNLVIVVLLSWQQAYSSNNVLVSMKSEQIRKRHRERKVTSKIAFNHGFFFMPNIKMDKMENVLMIAINGIKYNLKIENPISIAINVHRDIIKPIKKNNG